MLKIILPLLDGTLITLELFAVTLVFSIPLGILLALARISKNTILNKFTSGYVWILRGTPLLLQVFFVYYGIPVLFRNLFNLEGVGLDRFWAAALAFVLNYAAYFTEIYRAGIQSIDKGQYEASNALGMTYSQKMRRIVLPQTIKRVLPPVSNETITLIKDTALVYAIGMSDLLRNAKIIVSRDFDITPFLVAALFYLFMTYIITKIFEYLEKKYAYYD